MRSTLLITFLGLAAAAGCDSTPSREDVLHGERPQVRNIRPDVPNEKATLLVQAETIFLRLDADTSELWSFVSTQGLDGERVKLWEKNGLRVGTVDPVSMAQFMAKLPRTGGSKKLNIGAGREPVVLETTPNLPRAVELRALLGIDRDETIRLPAGRMQLILDVLLSESAILATLTPHHHWVTPTLEPRTPDEKALDGRVFKELALEADLTDDRLLVVAWRAPEPEKVEAPAVDETSDDAGAAGREDTPARLGDVLLTGTRAGRPLQLICVIRVPRQGEALPVGPTRPD